METVKKCNRCGITKAKTEFFVDKNHSSGRYSLCKECKKETVRRWREKNRERYNAMMRERHRVHYQRNRLYRYKMTVEAYEAMIKAQDNSCAICKRSGAHKRRSFLTIDHDHNSGRVRGLLCYSCNRAISVFDKAHLLEKVMRYLE